MREKEEKLKQERERERQTCRKRSFIISTPASIMPISASASLGKVEKGTSLFKEILSPASRYTNSVVEPGLDFGPLCPLGQATVQLHMETLVCSLLIFSYINILILLFSLAKMPSTSLHQVYHHQQNTFSLNRLLSLLLPTCSIFRKTPQLIPKNWNVTVLLRKSEILQKLAHAPT